MVQDEEDNEDDDGATCVQCGAAISESSDRCAKCGWTWKSPGQNEMFQAPEEQVTLELHVKEEPTPLTWQEIPRQEIPRQPVRRDIPMQPTKPVGPNPIALLIGVILCAIFIWLSLR